MNHTAAADNKGEAMRQWGLALLAMLVIVPAATRAQGWFEFESVDDRFGVNFPSEPALREFDYASEFDATFPARTFSAQSGSNVYSVTVVDFTDSFRIHSEMEKVEAAQGANVWINDQRASIARAAREYRERGGQVTYDAWSHIDLVEGHQLQITNADGTRTFAGIYMNGNTSRLYVLEATVPQGSPPPGQFQQSLRFLDENGERVRYRLSPNGCSIDER
jgi:hypothetical protein